MPDAIVQVPICLLSDPDLTPAAKVLWLALQTDPPPASPGKLAANTGLTIPTVRKHLSHLTASLSFAGPQVSVPADLLRDKRVRPGAKLLYALLRTLPQTAFTYASLSAHARVSVPTARQLVRELAAAGWLQASQVNQLAPVEFTLTTPSLDQRSANVALARARLTEAGFEPEAIMKEYLSLLIASDEFEDNARPGFLVNPQTDERLELDRYYPPGVAFEYNGQQHYRTTKRFPNPRKVAAQQTRDLIKEALCARRGIRLVVIHREDLTLERMRQKVGTLLPLRDLRDHEALIHFLGQVDKK